MFKAGELVCHPHHGVGVIAEIKRLKVTGEDTLYYFVNLATGEKLMIPIRKGEQDSLYAVTRPEDIDKVLSASPQTLPVDFRQRTLDIEKKVSSGDPLMVAEALRDLAWRKKSARLSGGDIRLMDKAHKTLANMLVVKPQMDLREASKKLDVMLKQIIAAWESAA